MRITKITELDEYPTRVSELSTQDAAHDHLSFGIKPDCEACAQLINDFTWARFHDAVDEASWPKPLPLEVRAKMAMPDAEAS